MEKGEQVYEKIAYTPDHCFINNDNILDAPVPEELDRQYYINMATDRLNQFLDVTEEKHDIIPEILYDNMLKTDNFYDFLELCTQTLPIKISNKIFINYIIADCCSKYGKTKHLLDFIKWFNLLYGKDKLTVKQVETKFGDIKYMIDKHSEPSTTGKTFIIDSKKILIELFDNIPNEDLYLPEILEMQIKLFENLRYVNSEMNENHYYVLNSRNEIKPNLIIYQLSTGNIVNVKVDKQMFDILFIQDGDIIQVNKSEYRYGVKIIGKDEDGVNIVDTDYNKRYLYLLGYDILYRDYSKSNKSLVED